MSAEIVELLDLAEIEALWGVSENKIYRAVDRGALTRFGRPGRRKFYSFNQLVELLGQPMHSPNRPSRTEKDDKGGYQQGFEFVRDSERLAS